MPHSLARSFVERAADGAGGSLGVPGDELGLDAALGFAAGLAQQLLDDGAEPGDRVALIASTSTDYLVTWLACLLAGTPVALVNPTYTREMLDEMLAPLRPARLLDDEFVAAARGAGIADLSSLPGLDTDAFAPASFMHTSGTTGPPKFCSQSHEYFARLAAAITGALDLTAADRVLAPLPMFHINPLGYGTVSSLLCGADVLALPRFSASRFWPTVIEEKVTVMILHAPPVEILKRASLPEDARGHRVRTMFYTDREFVERFEIPTTVSGYGSTEAAGISHLHRWSTAAGIPDDAGRHGGRGREDVEWRLDDAGTILVRERSPGTLFDGYLTPDGIDPRRDADGWFDTGDLGRVEAGEELVFLERRADSIRVKGEFVPIPFVEAHLATIEGLREYALWKRRGELVDDEIVLYAVSDAVPVDELRGRIEELPSFMRPAAVARVESLPRDEGVGKVRRRSLDDLPVLEWIELS